jgi:hypothetical protein
MAVGAEDDNGDLPRENRDGGPWSARAAAGHAGVDQSRRCTRPPGPRADPSGSRTRVPAGTQIARTYDCRARANPVCIWWGWGWRPRRTLTWYVARPCQTQTHHYVDCLRNRKRRQGRGRVGCGGSPSGPLDTRRTMSHMRGFYVRKTSS